LYFDSVIILLMCEQVKAMNVLTQSANYCCCMRILFCWCCLAVSLIFFAK